MYVRLDFIREEKKSENITNEIQSSDIYTDNQIKIIPE